MRWTTNRLLAITAISWLLGVGCFLFASSVIAADPAMNNRVLLPQQQSRLAEAEKLTLQAGKLYGQGNMRQAIPLAEQALAIRKEVLGEADPETALSMNNVGLLLKGLGKYATARPYLEQALAINKKALGEKHPITASALNNLGTLLHAMGDYAAARPCYEQALAIRKEILGEKHADTALSLISLGAVLNSMGDYAAARPYYEQGLAINQAVLGDKHPETATSLNNLGVLLESMGDRAAARLYYEQALAIRREVLGEKHPDTAASINCLGHLSMAAGDYPAARRYYERALAIRNDALGEKHPETMQSLNNLGFLLKVTGDYAAARRYLEQALAIRKEILGEKHRDTASSLNNLATLLYSMEDFSAARPYYEQALAINQAVLGEKHPETALAFDNLATLEAASGHWDDAVQNIEQGRHVVRRHVARVLPGLSEKEQLSFLEKVDAGPFHASLSLGLHEKENPAVAAISAAWLANGKAVAQEALAARALLARESANSQQAQTVAELSDLRRQLAALAMRAAKPNEIAARQEQLAKLEQQEQQLSRRLSQAGGQSAPAEPWIELAQLRAALPADAMLIDVARFDVFEFAAKGKEKKWRPAHYAAWLIPPAGKGDVRIVDLGEAKPIDDAVTRLQTAMQAAIGTAKAKGLIAQQGEPEAEKRYQRPLNELSALALHPILQQIGPAKQLLLSPDAALWLVPWSALSLSDGRYAIEEYQIRYLVSSRDLLAQGSKLTTNAPIVMADPNYDLGPAETVAATRAVLRGAGVPGDDSLRAISIENSALPTVVRLPGTAAEAKAIAPQLASYAHAEPTVYTDQYALEGVLKSVHRPRVLVLSTHGFFLPDRQFKPEERTLLATADTRSTVLTLDGKPLENPLLRCGLLLAGCNARQRIAGGDDGILTGMEIVGTDLRGTELVVLSACETGLGQVRNGEGVAGLRQAFQLSGAQAVVATLWQVPDRQSAQLMSDFFSNLAAGQNKAAALRNAQLSMIAQRRDKFGAAHPFFWAAFTLTGR